MDLDGKKEEAVGVEEVAEEEDDEVAGPKQDGPDQAAFHVENQDEEGRNDQGDHDQNTGKFKLAKISEHVRFVES